MEESRTEEEEREAVEHEESDGPCGSTTEEDVQRGKEGKRERETRTGAMEEDVAVWRCGVVSLEGSGVPARCVVEEEASAVMGRWRPSWPCEGWAPEVVDGRAGGGGELHSLGTIGVRPSFSSFSLFPPPPPPPPSSS